MKLNTTAFRFPRSRSRNPFIFQSTPSSLSSFSRSQSSNHHKRPSFGIAFDIDGVILRGRVPIGRSPQALRRLYDDSGTLKVPFLFLTNGGGIPESRRATELSELLGVNIVAAQVLQGHTFFKKILTRYENELIVATGKGEPALVMSEYGFRKVVSMDEYASYFQNIDPVSQYKSWTNSLAINENHSVLRHNSLTSTRVEAVFVISDPVDWGRDIQVISDILRSGGIPGKTNGQQPSLYFAADDLEYQAAFPSKRLGIGAFRIALESIFNR